MTSVTETQRVSQTAHPAFTHLGSKQETLNQSPHLTPPAPGTSHPWLDHRPRPLQDKPRKVVNQMDVVPLGAFCPVSFHGAPAKTLRVDLPVSAPLTMTVHQLVENLLTVTTEPG